MRKIYEKYRKALEKLYTDKADIYRWEKVKNEEMNTTVMDNVLKYKDVPCRISQKTLATNNQGQAQNTISYETRLFINPDIELKQGDRFIVTRDYKARKYTTGEPFLYPTHQEISIERNEWA